MNVPFCIDLMAPYQRGREGGREGRGEGGGREGRQRKGT